MRYILSLLLMMCLLSFVAEHKGFEGPAHFPQPQYNFDNNPVSPQKIALGRALFYDPILSRDSSISCASCHSPYNAFAHTDHDLSHGINDQIGTRNAPPLFNLAWQTTFMWDGAINHLDMQALAPISHPAEMGEEIAHVVNKLQQKAIYPALFYAAFEDSAISGAAVLQALSQFQLSLISAEAKYDQVKRGEVTFTAQESKGYALFQQHCNSCHSEPLFSSNRFENNGLPVDTTLNDFGKWMISKQSKDSLLFKVPSLRNLSFTFPYMHDGRFNKLREVLDHYSDGINTSSTLSKEIAQPLGLTSNEKVDIIAFLLTLNDRSFVFNPQHQYPKEILHPGEGFKD